MGAVPDDVWRGLLGRRADVEQWPLYGALIAEPAAPDGMFVLGRIAQSLDGRIATLNGASRWISGQDDLVHTHRLRALSDAVVVGAGTVRADDPQLTTRHVSGPSPVRVIIDTNRRLDATYGVFRDGGTTLLLHAADCAGPARIGDAEAIAVRRAAGWLDPSAVLATLCARGLRRVFVEGGGVTVSRWLAAGVLDRLHVTIAPLLLGSGIPAFTLPEAGAPADGMRLDWSMYRLGDDLLLDIPLHRARPGVCQ